MDASGADKLILLVQTNQVLYDKSTAGGKIKDALKSNFMIMYLTFLSINSAFVRLKERAVNSNESNASELSRLCNNTLYSIICTLILRIITYILNYNNVDRPKKITISKNVKRSCVE